MYVHMFVCVSGCIHVCVYVYKYRGKLNDTVAVNADSLGEWYCQGKEEN